MGIILPEHVKRILAVLEQAGHQAYVAGGAVRDLLLGKLPGDYDIATSAKPDEVIEAADRQGWKVVDRLGHNFGVVMIVINGQPFEVATFRGERYGADSHRPEAVWYADNLSDDLARRDFTINAMAVGLSGDIVDLYGGQCDLADKLIRTVGDPYARFQEDALRMFRACRFAGQLGFDIADETLKAIPSRLDRVSGLSLARVKGELDKMLVAQHPWRSLNYLVTTGLGECCCRIKEYGEYKLIPILPELSHLVNLPQNPAFHRYDGWQHTLAAVEGVPADLLLRWAALLHDVAKGLPGIRAEKNNQPTDHGHDKAGAKMARDILARFKLPPGFINRISWLVARHMRFYCYLNGEWKLAVRWLREEARSGFFRNQQELSEALGQLTLLCTADINAAGHGKIALDSARTFGDYLNNLSRVMPVHTSDLDYRAKELTEALGGQRELIGPFLKLALVRVQDGSLEGDFDAIIQAARRWFLRHKADR